LPRWLASDGGLSATVKSTFTAASLFSYIFRRQNDIAGLLKVASCHQVCSYETLDVDDPESSDSAVIASAAIAMRIERESG
jgi:hypothetical protein